jgi:outer membrane protein OmpA-like peptidoglycan-associated protein
MSAIKPVLAGIAASLLFACSSPPKPPVVDGQDRRPVNSLATVEMLKLRALQAPESKSTKEEREQIMRLLEQEAQKSKAGQAEAKAETPSVSNSPVSSPPVTAMFRHHFPYGGTSLDLSDKERTEILLLATNADRIEVHGRTDGRKASPGDEAVALARAKAARDWLVQKAGFGGEISINVLSAGDYIADNKTPEGQALNRRVDIHFYPRP